LTAAGYSGSYSDTPLWKKLGIAPGGTMVALGAPKEYTSWVAPLPAGAKVVRRAPKRARAVHLFVTDAAELGRALADWRRRIDPDGFLWVSWPKKASKLPTDVTEDTIRALALPLGWVDVKVCAVTDVWSGLKLVVRKALR
jgi:hypothetical protein